MRQKNWKDGKGEHYFSLFIFLSNIFLFVVYQRGM